MAVARVHRVSKHLQQGIESDHFHVKKNMPKVGGFQSFQTARKTIAGFESVLWLKKGLDFAGEWTARKQNELLACCFVIPFGRPSQAVLTLDIVAFCGKTSNLASTCLWGEDSSALRHQ